jgi:hypothetical protein
VLLECGDELEEHAFLLDDDHTLGLAFDWDPPTGRQGDYLVLDCIELFAICLKLELTEYNATTGCHDSKIMAIDSR